MSVGNLEPPVGLINSLQRIIRVRSQGGGSPGLVNQTQSGSLVGRPATGSRKTTYTRPPFETEDS